MAEFNGSAAPARETDPGRDVVIRETLARVSALGCLVLNAVKSRREYHDGKLHVAAEDIADALHAIACQGRDARQLFEFDLPGVGMDWAHLWSIAALLDAEGMRWLEVHQGEPPEHDLAAAEAALGMFVETGERIAAQLEAAATAVEC